VAHRFGGEDLVALLGLPPKLMRAAYCVDAFFREEEARNRRSIDDVGLDDLGHVFRLHTTVPDAFGVDDDCRTVFALVKTTRLVCPHGVGKAARGQFLFEA